MVYASTSSLITDAPRGVIVQFSEVLVKVLAERQTSEIAVPIHIRHPECSIISANSYLLGPSLPHSFIDNLFPSFCPVTALITPCAFPFGSVTPRVSNLKKLITFNFQCIKYWICMALHYSQVWGVCVSASRGGTSHHVAIVDPKGKSLPEFSIIKQWANYFPTLSQTFSWHPPHQRVSS